MHASFSSIALGLFALHAVALPVEETAVAVDASKNKTLIDAATYQQLVHYAPFPEVGYQLADGACVHPPYNTVIVDSFSVNDTDTQAAIFRDDSAREFIVGIPGTDSSQDFLTDFTFIPVPYLAPNAGCFGCLIHLGFLEAWDSIADDISNALNDSLQAYPGYSVVISGHSLGGAIAALAFGSLKPQFGSVVKGTYTYGQPRTGNALFATYIDSLAGASDSNAGIFHRVTHYNDGVPQLPPTILGFSHSRTEYWESTLSPSQSTTYRCYGDEPADCNDSVVVSYTDGAHSTYAGLQYNCTTGS